MKTFLVIIFLLGIIQMILWASINWKKPVMEGGFLGSSLATILFTIMTLFIYENIDIPPAIDVYRGKTTLQITYKDSIPIDSVVVYKNK
jgi:K+ transporter